MLEPSDQRTADTQRLAVDSSERHLHPFTAGGGGFITGRGTDYGLADGSFFSEDTVTYYTAPPSWSGTNDADLFNINDSTNARQPSPHEALPLSLLEAVPIQPHQRVDGRGKQQPHFTVVNHEDDPEPYVRAGSLRRKRGSRKSRTSTEVTNPFTCSALCNPSLILNARFIAISRSTISINPAKGPQPLYVICYHSPVVIS